MNAITIELPEDLIAQMETLAREQGISINAVYETVARDYLEQRDIEKTILARSERGRALKDRALELLQRD